MIFSMTGYGKSSSSKNKISAEVEIKSVNSRFFEISLKVPSVLSPYDYEIRELIKSKVQRGFSLARSEENNNQHEAVP